MMQGISARVSVAQGMTLIFETNFLPGRELLRYVLRLPIILQRDQNGGKCSQKKAHIAWSIKDKKSRSHTLRVSRAKTLLSGPCVGGLSMPKHAVFQYSY